MAGPSARMTRREQWASVRPFLVPSRWRIVVISVLAIIGGFLEAAVVVLIVKLAFLIAQGGQGDDLGLGPFGHVKLTLPVLFVGAFTFTMLRVVSQLAISVISPRMTTELDGRLRLRAIESYLRSTWSKQSQEKEGHFLELAGTQIGRASTAVGSVTSGITQAFNLGALLLTAVIVDAVAATVVLIAVTALFFALRPLSRVSRRWSERQAQAGVRYTGAIHELLRSTQELKVFHAEDAVIARADSRVNDYEHAAFRNGVVRQVTPALYQGAALSMILGGLALASAVSGAEITALGSVVLLLFRALASSQGLQVTYQQMQELAPYLGRVQRALTDYEAHRDDAGHIPIDDVRSISFQAVSYSYHDGPAVVRDLSFEIESGTCIGVVGPSGAGKSTLVQLLLRLRPPSDGQICVNEINLSDVEAPSWFKRVALVPQDPLLIEGSIADNIRFFRDIPMPAIIEAAKRANLDEEITESLGGYEAMIGPRDRAISGGQRQRLALARALAGQPQLLILDEPTSALDLRSENAVHQSLSSLHGEVTLVIVAHRLSTLGICDRIVVLEKGQLTAYLPPDQLAAENDFFRESVDLSRLGLATSASTLPQGSAS